LKPVINITEVAVEGRGSRFTATGPAAERYDASVGHIGPRIGLKQLGCNVTAVPPGKRAYPRHNHQVNEELFLVLSGTGEAIIGSERYPVRPGDLIACPAGGPETAHQLVNTGDVELRYLALSTKRTPEVVEYPDSGKFAVLAECAPRPGGEPRVLRYVGRESQGVDYWDGE
jgi:uncharacterized cupin superfamily protein